MLDWRLFVIILVNFSLHCCICLFLDLRSALLNIQNRLQTFRVLLLPLDNSFLLCLHLLNLLFIFLALSSHLVGICNQGSLFIFAFLFQPCRMLNQLPVSCYLQISLGIDQGLLDLQLLLDLLPIFLFVVEEFHHFVLLFDLLVQREFLGFHSLQGLTL